MLISASVIFILQQLSVVAITDLEMELELSVKVRTCRYLHPKSDFRSIINF